MGWQQTPGFFVAPGVEGGFQRLPRWTSPSSLHAPVALGAPQINVFSIRPEIAAPRIPQPSHSAALDVGGVGTGASPTRPFFSI